MSLMHAKYPNLELLEFKARVMLSKDSEFTEEVDKKRKENKYRSVEFEAIVFSQMWGSTCTGFDVLKDGSPAIGGCAMTKEYTTVMHELLTDSYIVFFGAEPVSYTHLVPGQEEKKNGQTEYTVEYWEE